RWHIFAALPDGPTPFCAASGERYQKQIQDAASENSEHSDRKTPKKEAFKGHAASRERYSRRHKSCHSSNEGEIAMPGTTPSLVGGGQGRRSVTCAPPAARATTTPRKRLRPQRLLIYVDAVARHGSIRKAPAALNVASSALNRQILDLEMDLGSALFERLPRGLRATAAGELFLTYARKQISELKAVQSEIEQLRGLVRGQVGVAAVESVASELLPSTITQYQAAHPKVRFNVRIGALGELVSALVADQVDLILTHHTPPKKDAVVVTV